MPAPLPDKLLRVLLEPQHWRLVSTFLPRDVRPVKRPGSHAAHAHPHQEFLIVLSGRGTYAHGKRVYPTRSGTIFFFDRNEPHDNGYSPDNQEAIHLWIMIVEDRAFARFTRIDDGRFSTYFDVVLLPHDTGVDLQRAITDARQLAADSPGLARMRLLGTAAALCVRIVEAASQSAPRVSLQEQAIDAIKQHIAHTAGAGVSLDQLARISGFSKFHFLRLFKRHTGQTVHAYINTRRRQVVNDLRRQAVSHKEISARLGFSCPAAFSRWWSKEKNGL
ncbi:MAG TPA: AraC family transcriptional regulator [Planctomycetota bacterium]|nr:AraC family transcriptional regulator [Planctomycetota bacterium]